MFIPKFDVCDYWRFIPSHVIQTGSRAVLSRSFYGMWNVSAVKLSGSSVQLSGSSVELSGSSVEPSGSSVELSGSTAERSGSAIERSGSTIERSGSTHLISSVARGAGGRVPPARKNRSKIGTMEKWKNKKMKKRGRGGGEGRK